MVFSRLSFVTGKFFRHVGLILFPSTVSCNISSYFLEIQQVAAVLSSNGRVPTQVIIKKAPGQHHSINS